MPPEPHRFRGPAWIGLRFGAYLAGVECLVVLLPVMAKLQQSALALLLLGTAVLYALVFTGAGWLVGRIPPLRTRPWALLLSLLVALGLSTAASGENVVPVLLFGIPASLMAWAGTAMAGKPSKVRLALRILVVLVFGLLLLPILLPRPAAELPPRAAPPAYAPDLVLVVLDTVRKDHLCTYGYELETSPHLTALAAQGMRFDDARVNGMWSLPSHATFFTGLHPSQHGAHYERWELGEEPLTLATLLAAHGYQTVCVTGNPLISRGLGTARGFEVVEESWRSHWVQESLNLWRVLRFVWDRDHDKGGAAGVRFLSRWLTDERDPERPLFLFVNVMDPHAPYNDVPATYQEAFLPEGVSRGEARRLDSRVFFHHVFASPVGLDAAGIDTVRRSYDGATLYGDAVLGDILAALEDASVSDDALVVVTSDHGELLGEHDLWGHVHSLYDELLAVPLVVRWPGRIPAGSVDAAPAQSLDIVPTFLAAAGVPAARWPDVHGQDLAAAWSVGAAPRTPALVVAEHFTPSMLPRTAPETMAGDLDELFVRRRCAVDGGTKYVVSSTGSEQVYDLSADLAETSVRTGGPALEQGRATVAAWTGALDVPWSDEVTVEGPTLDPATRERLEQLGYLDQE